MKEMRSLVLSHKGLNSSAIPTPTLVPILLQSRRGRWVRGVWWGPGQSPSFPFLGMGRSWLGSAPADSENAHGSTAPHFSLEEEAFALSP